MAIKKGQTRERTAVDFQEMGALPCDDCGEEFFIAHPPAFVDKSVADQQAHWLEKVLAEEHERDRKHPPAEGLLTLHTAITLNFGLPVKP